MSTSTATSPQRLRFSRTLLFPGGQGAAGLEIPSAGDSEIIAALTRNLPFPDRDIALGAVDLKADGGRDFAFGDSAPVSFKGSASAFAGLGIYRDPAAVLGALKFEDRIERGLGLEAGVGRRFLLLQWGYDAAAAAKGAVALGYGAKATFGVDARNEGVFAVVRGISADAPALDALESAVSSWRLPRQIRAADDLEPGTWIIAEVDGGIGLQLGAQFGYDFNWSRETALGGLKEDIGLRLQLAVNAAVGLSASGKYALVVARPSEARKLHLQVVKQSKKGLKFAFNAGADVGADFSNLPPGPDDFIKAVFDVHGAQIIDDLHAIEKWTNPDTPLSGPLAGLGVDYAKKLLSEITGVEHFEEARGRLLEFLKEWDSLPHSVSTMVYKLVEENRTEELDAVRAVSTALAKGSTAPIESELRKAAFFSTPAGRFLEAIATDGMLPLLTSGVPDSIRETAETATKLLDPAGLEKTLRGLQSALLARLNLDQLNAKTPDDWLKLKLSHFLGRTIDSNQDIQDVRKAIASLLARRKDFYEKAKAALTRRYEVHFAATYNKATTDTALIDAEFDFDQDAAAAAKLLSAALDGDFNALFTRESAAVRLNQAVLTHGITRNSHVEFSLPRYDRSTKHINEALAEVKAVQDGERMLAYNLEASDTVSDNQRNSRLAVAARLQTAKGTGVRVHSREGFTYSYSFRQAVRNINHVRPYLEQYFDSLFSGEAAIDGWISDLEAQAASGHTLLALDLSLPAAVAGSWLDAPKDKKAPQYAEMSRRIRECLKRVLPLYYFDDVSKYKDLASVAPLLVYGAIPPVEWDHADREKLKRMVFATQTREALVLSLRRAHESLVDSGMAGDAQDYEASQLDWFCKKALTPPVDTLLGSLLFVEAEIVAQARKAGLAIAKFREEGWKDPQKAVKALAEFGSSITEAFNSKVGGVYGGGALRPLGTMLFVEAAGAFSTEAANAKPAALFELTVVKQTSEFDLTKAPSRDDILLQERLLAV